MNNFTVKELLIELAEEAQAAQVSSELLDNVKVILFSDDSDVRNKTSNGAGVAVKTVHIYTQFHNYIYDPFFCPVLCP